MSNSPEVTQQPGGRVWNRKTDCLSHSPMHCPIKTSHRIHKHWEFPGQLEESSAQEEKVILMLEGPLCICSKTASKLEQPQGTDYMTEKTKESPAFGMPCN